MACLHQTCSDCHPDSQDDLSTRTSACLTTDGDKVMGVAQGVSQVGSEGWGEGLRVHHGCFGPFGFWRLGRSMLPWHNGVVD